MIERWEAQWRAGGDLVAGVFLGPDIVGGCGLHRRTGPDSAEIGSWIHPAFTRRRIATTVARVLTDAAFTMASTVRRLLLQLRWLAQPGTLRGMELSGGALSQLRRGVLEFCVLALLRDGERYSYEIVVALGQADGLVTTEGTLYPLLSRLRKERVLSSSWRESPNGPPRRYYGLTADGQSRLDAFSVEWKRFRDSVDLLLTGGITE